MREISYFAPTDVGEAVKLLAQHGAEVAVLAGGTDLVAQLNYYEIKPSALLYIGQLGLSYVKEKDGELVIGAGTTVESLRGNALVAEKVPVLIQAAEKHASIAVRTAATIGGNLGTASPAGDLIPPLMAMDATVRLVSVRGERSVRLDAYFTGPGQTVKAADELIVEIRVPLLEGKAVFEKLGRRKAQQCSIVTATARLAMDGDVCREARIVLGSMAPTPIRCPVAEKMLIGHTIDEALIAECAAQAIAESSPITDQRATAWYRQKAGTVLVARVLAEAAGVES